MLQRRKFLLVLWKRDIHHVEGRFAIRLLGHCYRDSGGRDRLHCDNGCSSRRRLRLALGLGVIVIPKSGKDLSPVNGLRLISLLSDTSKVF